MKIDPEKTSMEIELPLSTTTRSAPSTHFNKIPEINNPIISKKGLEEAAEIKTEIISIPIENKPIAQETQKQPVLSNNLGNLHFKFIADSWVKVTDGKGVSVFEQLKKEGSEQMVTGQKPFSIVIGNAAGVNLIYNDTRVDISSYKKKDGTARFTLE
jgi:cytoskeleton protein RodZ